MEYKVKELKLIHTWTIARNSADVKRNVFVRYTKDNIEGIGEAAPNIRYNETPESTIDTIEKASSLFDKYDPWQFVDLGNSIKKIVAEQTAAKCAMDIALIDWVTKKLGIPLYKYLGLDKSKTPITSFSIGIDKTGDYAEKKS